MSQKTYSLAPDHRTNFPYEPVFSIWQILAIGKPANNRMNT
jgi:hypothetical protein